jgi:hypothetical protein
MVLSLWMLSACGGSEKGTEPPGTDPPGGDPPADTTHADGRVFLENGTAYGVEVAYLNRVAEGEPRIIRTVVAAGESRDIGQALLPGGGEVEFDLVLLLPEDLGFRVRRKAQIVVDGDVVLRISLETADDPFSVLIE